MDVEGLKNTARAHEREGQIDQALSAYRQILTHLEKTGSVRQELPLYVKAGDLFLKTGDERSALGLYGRAARHYAETGSVQRVVALCGKILRVSPSHTYIYPRLARVMISKEHIDAARQLLVDYARRTKQDAGRDALERLAGLPDQQVETILEKLLDAAEKREAVLAKRLKERAAKEREAAGSAEPAAAPPAPEPEPPAAPAPAPPAVEPPAAPEPLELERASVPPPQPKSPEPPPEPEPIQLETPGDRELEPSAPEAAPEPEPIELESFEPAAAPEPVELEAAAEPIAHEPEQLDEAPDEPDAPYVPPSFREPPAEPAYEDHEPAYAPIRSRSTEDPVVFVGDEESKGSGKRWMMIAGVVAVGAVGLVATGIIPLGGGGPSAPPPGTPAEPIPPPVVTDSSGIDLAATDTLADSGDVLASADSLAADSAALALLDTTVTDSVVGATDSVTIASGAVDTLRAGPVPGATDTTARDTAISIVPQPPPVVAPVQPSDTTPGARPAASRPAVIIANLPVRNTQPVSTGVRVDQTLASGQAVTVLTMPFGGDTSVALGVVTVPGDTAVGTVRFGRFLVTVRALVPTDTLEALLRRLTVAPSN